ncbi:hypothetical protein B4N89_45650 [Embleya scabrispora]|uniref:Uncharacterized protein n=1 Tax=Embleya scabrispora TaxID=159449 RepID=A0A1T3NIV3_9ACTN|nr:hypothetical protein [Embleya scabrispora]OPC76766.1 hypothetical protein B4N89_45650 [Embleya scabrispora]
MVNELGPVERLGMLGLAVRGADFKEQPVTNKICEVFDGLGKEAGRLVLDALLSGVDPQVCRRIVAGRPLWMWLPKASPGPDFGLIDEEGNVVAVFEHKRGAQANAPALDTLARSGRFDDPIAQSLAVPDHTPGRHTPQECRSCRGWWHQPQRHGLWVAGIPQNDLYRCTPGHWVRPLADGTRIRLDAPADVLWIIFDRDGRTAEEIFPESHTADEWWTTSYSRCVAGLLDAYALARADGETGPDALDRLGRIIEMLVYA